VRDARTPLLVVALLAVVSAGCHGFEPTVRRSMSADLRCPEEQIKVQPETGGVYQTEGCGKTATYDCWWPEGGTRTCVRRGAPSEKRLPGTSF